MAQTDLERMRHYMDAQHQQYLGLFEGTHGRPPETVEELADWVFSEPEEVRAAMARNRKRPRFRRPGKSRVVNT